MKSSVTAISRKPAVAGLFYPDDPAELHDAVVGFLGAARSAADTDSRAPKALVVPHAGYIYSGAVAASGYCRITQAANTIERVVLLGPAHRLAFEGLALPDADSFETPLGPVPIDAEAVAQIAALPQIVRLPAAQEQLMKHCTSRYRCHKIGHCESVRRATRRFVSETRSYIY